jgi:hypothetical protein
MMRRLSATAALMLMLFGAGGSHAEVRLSDVIEVLGRVTESQRPVDEALVIAFNLSNSYIVQTFTEAGGRFEFPPLPSGVYRIIAVKRGFAPAVATVTPSVQKGREISLQLREANSLSENDRNAIWQARRAIPSDVLRELGIVDESIGSVVMAAPKQDRFSGEMLSIAGIAQGGTTTGYAGTEVGVRGGFGDGWMVDVSGAIRTFDDGLLHDGGESMAEATGVTMALHSAQSSSYELASFRNSWALSEAEGIARVADLESHRFGFSRPNTNFQVRYVAHQNLFGPRAGGSEMFELQAEQNLHRSERSEIGVGLRVGQESFVGQSVDVPFRSADLRTRGSYELTPGFLVKYGLNSRLTEYGTEWQPESGLLIRFSPATAILVTGSYKVQDIDLPAMQPSIVFLDRNWSFAPKYRYAVEFTSGKDEASRFSAGASIAELDSVLRLVFDESFQDFWDALYFEPGDVYQTVNVGMQKTIGHLVALDLVAEAGEASGTRRPNPDKHFMTGSLQTLYIPSGTAVRLAWRYIEQPADVSGASVQESERLNLRLAQSLGLPLGLRVLVGVDLARARNSWVLADAPESVDGYQRRIVGGLSLAF